MPSLVAIYQDATGKALDTALAYAKGIGATRAGVLETSFEEETETPTFSASSACSAGAYTELVKAGFDTLVEAGYAPGDHLLQVPARTRPVRRPVLSGRHQLHALLGLRHRPHRRLHPGPPHHHRGDPGGNGPDPGRNATRGICPGVWILENQAGRPVFNALRRIEAERTPSRTWAKKLRGMMPWLQRGTGGDVPVGGGDKGTRPSLSTLK